MLVDPFFRVAIILEAYQPLSPANGQFTRRTYPEDLNILDKPNATNNNVPQRYFQAVPLLPKPPTYTRPSGNPPFESLPALA